MLWRIPADTRTTRIGIMLSHFDGSTAGATAWSGIDSHFSARAIGQNGVR